jgi:RND family efflux transporter MFP subunit
MQNVPATDLERTRNEVETLRERVRAEQVELDRVVTILRQQAGVLQDRKARCLITSPLDGYLNAINCANGEFISENSTPFAVATHSTYLEGQINEEDVGQVAPNMKAAVRLYSYANQDFTATVSQILPTANNQRYTITLTLDNAPPNLMSGMTGEMNIIAGKRENALIIPSRAVLAGRVFVVKDNVVKPRAVKVGFRNLERAEILEGLKDGEQVVVADQDLFRPGQRVRAVTINM